MGADPKEEAPDGTVALLLAAGSKKLEAVKMLVELGADINEAPKDRPNALHAAVRSGDNEMIQYLADHGADFNSRDAFGRTPLEEAEFEAPKPTIDLMRKLAAEAAEKKKQ
ncbi:MAG: ankyrin repeat domain-containing protein [Bryobacteraceae bacterium]